MEYGDIKQLLKDKLEEEGFDISGKDTHDDTLVFKTANKDLWNYMRNLYGKENLFLALSEKFITIEEAKEFMGFWFPTWLHKWKTRTKICLSKNDISTSKRISMIPKKGFTIKRILPPQIYDKLVDEMIRELIKIGEICGTVLLAEVTLVREFNSHQWNDQRKKGYLKIGDVINITVSAKKRIRELKYHSGPLIIIEWSKSSRQ